MANSIPYVYLLLYSALKKRNKPYMSKSDVDQTIKQHLRVCNTFRLTILKDMEQFGLVKQINRQEFRILEGDYEKELDNFKKYGKWVSSIPE